MTKVNFNQSREDKISYTSNKGHSDWLLYYKACQYLVKEYFMTGKIGLC